MSHEVVAWAALRLKRMGPLPVSAMWRWQTRTRLPCLVMPATPMAVAGPSWRPGYGPARAGPARQRAQS